MTNAPTSRRKPTQGDVARLADVSQTAVSYVLSNNPSVQLPDETRQRIHAAARELGYVPNSAARSLRTRKTLTVACIIPDITNPFYPAFERGVQDVTDVHDYNLIVFNTDGDRQKEHKSLQVALEGRVDGMIMTPFQLGPEHFEPLVQNGVEVCVLGKSGGAWSSIGIDGVVVDNVSAARMAVEHLFSIGRTRVAMVAGVSGTPPRERRVEGYLSALAAHDVPAEERLIRAGEFSERGGYQATRELLKTRPWPDAIFAANDLMAIGCMQALREAGISVPDDVALVGFDNIAASRLVHPALTTVDQHAFALGKRCAEMLFDRLTNRTSGPGLHVAMPHELIVRESA